MSLADARPTISVDQSALDDARRAAEVCIADPRVGEVLLFGSVARGEARVHSDVDLVVLIDPDWGKQHLEIAKELKAAVRDATGLVCDVVARTPAVWKHLLANVSASFEAHISRDVMSLAVVDRGWREGGLQDMTGVDSTNEEVSVDVLQALRQPASDLYRTLNSIRGEEEGFTGSEAVEERAFRFLSVLEKAHLGIELAIKSVAVATDGKRLAKTHDLEQLLDAMSDSSARQLLVEAVEKLKRHQSGVVVNWRLAAYFGLPSTEFGYANPVNARQHVEAFLACVEVAVDVNRRTFPTSAMTDACDTLKSRVARIRSLSVDEHFLVHGGPMSARPGWLKRLLARTSMQTSSE